MMSDVLSSQWPEDDRPLTPQAEDRPQAVASQAVMTGPVSKAFILAGRAMFTVANPTGERYTIRVSKVDNDPSSRWYRADQPSTWFVGLLTGPNNDTDYTYVGMLSPTTGQVILTRKSPYSADSKVYKVVQWAIKLVLTGKSIPNGYSLLHSGKCGRCGRTLTVPSSIETGLGPECASKV